MEWNKIKASKVVKIRKAITDVISPALIENM